MNRGHASLSDGVAEHPKRLGSFVSQPIFVPVYRETAQRPGIDLTAIHRAGAGTVRRNIPLVDSSPRVRYSDAGGQRPTAY